MEKLEDRQNISSLWCVVERSQEQLRSIPALCGCGWTCFKTSRLTYPQCFLSIPAIIYLVMVPMWSRAQRFANAYAFLAVDALYTILWFAAFIAVAMWNSKGIKDGAAEKKIADDDRNCTTFKYGSESKCTVSKAAVGMGALILYVPFPYPHRLKHTGSLTEVCVQPSLRNHNRRIRLLLRQIQARRHPALHVLVPEPTLCLGRNLLRKRRHRQRMVHRNRTHGPTTTPRLCRLDLAPHRSRRQSARRRVRLVAQHGDG